MRTSVGQGYVLAGRVLSARDGSALPGAVLELWLAGPDGDYTDDYRATLHYSQRGRREAAFDLVLPAR